LNSQLDLAMQAAPLFVSIRPSAGCLRRAHLGLGLSADHAGRIRKGQAVSDEELLPLMLYRDTQRR
jgi:hypothetical protein